MRIPLINTDISLSEQVYKAMEGAQLNGLLATDRPDENHIDWVPLTDEKSAIDYINYQTPALLALNFSDPNLDAAGIIETIAADPWLNNGGLIVFHNGLNAEKQLEELPQTNIVISLPYHEIPHQLARVLEVIAENRQILFHRSILVDFSSTILGNHSLSPDTHIIPCYVNLISNYLFNMGFVSPDTKSRLGLSLTEMLMNAIEHGCCGITFDEKAQYLEKHGNISGLILERVKSPEVAKSKLIFEYNIQRTHSTFRIEDSGPGFDWRPMMDKSREVDILSQHGRGLLLTLNSMDEVSFNEKGNAVTMRLNHAQNTTNTVPAVFQDQDMLAVDPGTEIFRQGEASDYLYYIAEGEFAVLINKKQIATVTPADILVGEMSFLLDETRSATMIAVTPGRLMKISKASFITAIRNQPYYGLFLAKLLAQRLDRMGRALTA